MYRLITSTLKPSGLWGDIMGGLGDIILWEIHEACAARFAGGGLAAGEADWALLLKPCPAAGRNP